MFESLRCRFMSWVDGFLDESDQEWDAFYWKIEKAKLKPVRYIDSQWEEQNMQKKRRKTKNYPLEVILSSGEKIIIPRQSKFKNEWLREHGCSLMAEYIALQYLGQEKIKVNGRNVGIYPVNLLKWHKKHTPDQVKAKVTVKGVAEGINELAKGKGMAKYYKTVSAKRIKKALKDGDLVIMEQGNPIHTIVLLPDKNGAYIANHGKVEKVNVDDVAKKATNDRKYRGMVIVSKGGDHEID